MRGRLLICTLTIWLFFCVFPPLSVFVCFSEFSSRLTATPQYVVSVARRSALHCDQHRHYRRHRCSSKVLGLSFASACCFVFTEHHKSLQNLKEGGSQPRIVVDGAGDADVTAGVEGVSGDGLSIEQAKKQQVRRSSWCPEEERRKEDKSDNLLYVTGRRCVDSNNVLLVKLCNFLTCARVGLAVTERELLYRKNDFLPLFTALLSEAKI